MASDMDVDFDWGDDPFGSDIDFDMDFNMDPFKGKGFVRSLASGFLSGIVHETVGTGENRFRSLRTILPSTFTTALDRASFLSDRISDLAKEFKEENAESVKSLQNIAGHINSKMGSKLPGFASSGLENFSNKDFSSWEKLADGDSGRFSARLESSSNDEYDSAVDQAESGQSSMFASLGESLNSMTAATTAMLNSSIGVGNRQLVNIEGAMRDMLNYQRNVDARIQQAQLNLMARSYVQDAKYYKFMEAGIHAEVAELKKIVKYTGMSDYEKTSNLTASKAFIRNSVFNTIGKRVGGITGTLRDKFSKENRSDTYGAFGSLFGEISSGLDMGGGSLSKGMVGDILGKMVAGVAIEKLPGFFTYGPGKKAIDKMMKAYPEQGDYIKDQIKKLTDIGNVVSYASTSGAGMLNYMAENYEAMDEMKFADYDDYLANLPPGKKPLPKAAWTVINGAGNRAKESINKLMSDVTKSRGTQYTMKKRNVKDLNQPGIWKEINNITLNEVLPGLISKTNQILEQLRTGKNDVEGVSYNYMRGEFQTESQKRVSVQADLMPHGEFERYASASLALIDSVDPDKMLSAGARKAFALQVAKDIDAEMGFNPYYYLGDIKGVSPGMQKEIHAVLMRHFGISNQDISEFKGADSFQRMKKMSVMGTEQGRENLNKASASAANIKQNFPNVAERIDLLRSTGNEQMLRDLGVIYTENGIDKINMQAFHDRIGMYMDNPNNPALKGTVPGAKNNGPTVNRIGARPGNPGPTVNPYDELNKTLGTLNDRLSTIGEQTPQPKGGGSTGTVNFDSISGEITDIKDSNRLIQTSSANIEALLTNLYKLAEEGKLFTGKPDNKTDEQKEEGAKKSLLGKIKGFLPKGLGGGLGSGLDFIMSRNPMVLGGILGAFGAAATAQNPLLSGALAGAGLLGGYLVDRYKKRGAPSGPESEPSDDEDIIDETGEPILKSSILKAGQYLDAATKKVIKSWKDIRGPIYNAATKTVIGARDLAGKIFGSDGRAVALSGLRYVRDKTIAGYNLLDPIGRIKSMVESGKEMIYQQDVYLKSNPKEPILRASKFKSGDYYIRDQSGNFKPISGWNEIDGAVYDDQGNQLVSEEEYQSGLVTSTGMAVRNMGAGAAGLVGGAAGILKGGLNKILGRFGYSSGQGNDVGNASDPKGNGGGSLGGVELRLDRIYKMMSEHFNIPMDLNPYDNNNPDAPGGGKTGGANESGDRLNSLAWKEKEKEKEEKHRVNEAIIKISENTEGLGGPTDDKDDKKGFWGTVKGILGGLGTFGMKLIKNPIGTIGSLVFGSLVNSTARLAKIGTALFSGVMGAASPIYKLMKWGFGKLASGIFSGRGGAGGDGDDDLGPDQRGQSGRRRRRNGRGRGRRRVPSRLGSILKGGAIAAGGAMAINALTGYNDDDFQTRDDNIEDGERNELTGRYNTGSDDFMDTVTDYIPQGMIAKSLVQGVLGPERYKEWDNKGLFWTSDGSFFFDRRKRDAAQAVLDGKPVIEGSADVKQSNTKLTTQKKIRLAMYGVSNPNSNLAGRILALERQFYQYVVIRGNDASLKPETPTDKLVDDFANSGMGPKSDKSQVKIWFNARFKPIFMTYNVAVSIARMGDLVEFDNSKSYDVVQVIERVTAAIASKNPPPYTVDTRIDDNEATMGPDQTRAAIAVLFKELKKDIPSPNTTVESIATTEEAKAKVEASATDKSSNPLPGMAAMDALGSSMARASQAAIDDKFKQPSDVTTIDVSDMLPGEGKPMDAFTMVRLAAYGNIDNIPWRVEAVLRLERYMENFIIVVGDDAKFTGKSNQVMEMFKASFRLDSDIAKNNWSTWFRDRFLPVLMEYSKLLYKLRGGLPSTTWKALSATNRAMVARKLTEIIVSVNDEQISIWEVEASPFPNSKSGKWSDRADKYLAILDIKAQEARLKDPELEDEKSKATVSSINTPADTGKNMQQRTQDIMNSVYKTGSTGSSGTFTGSGGAAYGASGAGGYTPNATMSAPGGGAGSAGSFMGQANSTFSPEFIKQAGEDKGIKMSLGQGEQLMLNHLVKAGFKDNKTLALALAMAKKETGGYSSTVENTNWSAPTLLKYFKNIPDAATAQKVAAMSPAERAMFVYGRAPKGPSLGNQKPEDGFTYRGRGLFQLTGKSNYEAFKKASGIDVVSNPRIVSEDPNVMAESAVWFLKNNKAMQSIAQTGDFDTAVRGINGGNAVPATDERRQFYNDYLNRLRSGDLTIAGGTDSSAAQANDASAMAQQTPVVPEGADKNVPVDKATGPNAVPSPTKPGDTAALIASAGPTASNAGNTSTANASPLSSPSVTATVKPGPANGIDGVTDTGTKPKGRELTGYSGDPTSSDPTMTGGSYKDTPAAVAKQTAAKTPPPTPVNTNNATPVVDNGDVITAISGVAKILGQIRDKLPGNNTLPSVKV